jgi:hypothetical protein
MFHRAARLSSLFALGAICVWGLYFFIPRNSDVDKWHRYWEKKQLASSNKKSLSASTQQHRKGVRKDIWFSQDDGSRLHYRIESESSTLTLVPVKNKWDVIEDLQGIKGWTHDKLYYEGPERAPMQQVRFFDAQQGTYQYSMQKFLANSVALSLYRLPTHVLPTETIKDVPFLKGNANNVSFSVSEKNPQFQAQHFKAILKPQEK